MQYITDRMIDEFYGEVKPAAKSNKLKERVETKGKIVDKCAGCGKYLFAYDDVLAKDSGIYCDICAKEELLKEFVSLTLREQADILEYTFCDAEAVRNRKCMK